MTYIKKLREKIGSDRFIHPGARIIVENKNNEILIIRRKDNGLIGLPAGGLEDNETIASCIKREVYEETGLIIKDPQVIGISSDPNNEFVQYPNGDRIQYFTVEFYSNQFSGELNVRDVNEISEVRFQVINDISQFPKNERSAFESLEFFRKHKQIMLK